MAILLATGGARSGKSTFAQAWVEGFASAERPALYIATAEALDDEMARRVALHKQQRGKAWRTVEAPLNVAEASAPLLSTVSAVLLDCLTLLITNHMLARLDAEGEFPKHDEAAVEAEVIAQVAALADACKRANVPLAFVTNEVGQGVVPAYYMGRAFRDIAGRVNQFAASIADTAVMLVCGLPVYLKGGPK